MSEEIKELSDKIDRMRQEFIRDKYQTLGYVLLGFTLAMISLTVVNPHPANIAASVIFLFMGWIALVHSRRAKVK
jgi:hypothetical protein